MTKLLFVSPARITFAISETIITGNHIMVEGNRYEMVSRRPLGRRVLKKLTKVGDDSTKITIYA